MASSTTTSSTAVSMFVALGVFNYLTIYMPKYDLSEIKTAIRYWIKDWEGEGRPYGVNGITNIITKIVEQYIQIKIEQEVKKRDENMKINIGFLRQWLNERTSKDLITNEQIERWLFNEEIPMGASRWKEHGERFGYFEYFKNSSK